ncbi:hypothetical protein [Hymenobacter convexus]|uniref:hypothetical protein n=1 Tax=Hymenobacter sp. CA1UV-4 TaxID=3063782 RepID=UPI002712D7EF|nr:hypothetical protein [Hymenobacter sp. CA1UV-4]MDO7851368.1 hypothetical protein [Hymenobacter sp. CA1UV-4]
MYPSDKIKKSLEALQNERQHAIVNGGNPTLAPLRYPTEGQYFDSYLLSRLLDLEEGLKKAQETIGQLQEQVEQLQNPPQHPGHEAGGPVKKFEEF